MRTRRTLASLLVLALLPLAPARAQSNDATALKTADAAIAQVKVKLAELDKAGTQMVQARARRAKAPAPAATKAQGPAPRETMPAPKAPAVMPMLDPKTVEKQCREEAPAAAAMLSFAKTHTGDGDALKADLNAYFKCQAMVQGSDAPCAQMRGLCFQARERGSSECIDYGESCAEDRHRAQLSRALITGSADAARLCTGPATDTVHFNCVPQAGEGEPRAKDFQGKVCSAILPNLANPGVWKDKILPLCIQKPDLREIDDYLQELRALTGDEAACAASQVTDCKEMVLLRRAHQAKDPAACGKSAFCRWGMGGGLKSCDAYLEQTRTGYCRMFAAQRTAQHAKQAETAKQEQLKYKDELARAQVLWEFQGKKRQEELKQGANAAGRAEEDYSLAQSAFNQKQVETLALLNRIDSILDTGILDKDSAAPRQRKAQRNALFQQLDAVKKKYGVAGIDRSKPIRRTKAPVPATEQ